MENIYDPSVKYSRPKRKGIGTVSQADRTMMQPNENYRFWGEDCWRTMQLELAVTG